jgi:hypothetical protein
LLLPEKAMGVSNKYIKRGKTQHKEREGGE